MHRSLIAVVCTLLAVAPAATAQAETPVTKKTTVTAYGLDLQTAAGADLMLKRLEVAAERACGGRPPAVPLGASRMAGFEACRTRALSQAVADLGSPLVASRFQKGGEETRLLVSR